MANLPLPVESLPLHKIILDDRLQVRVRLSEETAQEYAEILDLLPPGRVYREGKKNWLVRGFTRHRAHQIKGRKHMLFEVVLGTFREALLASLSENADHGQRRTSADKRKAILTMLNDPEWSGWPNTWIAEACAVDEGTVRNVKKELRDSRDSETPTPPFGNGQSDPFLKGYLADRLSRLPEDERRELVNQAEELARRDGRGGARKRLCKTCGGTGYIL